MRNSELQIDLLKNLAKAEFKSKFEARLSTVSDENYYQIISEMRSIYIFEKILKLPIEDINVKTINEKDVDFTLNFENDIIYVEVKGSQAIENWKGGAIPEKMRETVSRAFERAQNKFLDKGCNILIVADENTIKIPVFDTCLLLPNIKEEIIDPLLNISPKTSALMILGGQYYKTLFRFSIFYNANSKKELPKKLKDILDLHKSNKE